MKHPHREYNTSLKEKLPPNRSPFLYSANVSNSFRERRGKSPRYMNGFFPHAIDLLNILIQIIFIFSCSSYSVLMRSCKCTT